MHVHIHIHVHTHTHTPTHSASDVDVICNGDAVCVDGVSIDVRIYGERVKATSSFKYLGVMFDADGGFASHVAAREAALEKACNMLHCGLKRMPSFPLHFALHLFKCLVDPAANYGMETHC